MAATTPFETTQEVLDYLKTTRHDTYDLSRCVKPHVRDVLTQLFLRINWMRTWFRTNHPNLMYQEDSPFKETIDFFKEVPEEDFTTIFTLWCLHLVNKLLIDSSYESNGEVIKTTESMDKQQCVLNTVSDITFHPAAKPMMLNRAFVDELGQILDANLVRSNKAEFTLITNPILAKEICTQVFFRSSDVRSEVAKAAAAVAASATTNA